MSLGDKRELYYGANDALARAMQLVIVPMLFGLAGYGLDRWLGLAPLLMLVLFLLGLVGCCLSIYYAYQVRMDAHEEGRALEAGEDGMTAPTPPPRPDAVERQIVFDIARRALMAAPLLVLVEALVWGTDGALCALYALGLVLVNFALSAALLGWAARMSLNGAMAVILGGFLVRMGMVAGAVLAVRNAGWVHPAALGVTIFVTHLGLVAWEARHLSLTLAFPGLKPTRGDG